MLQFPMHKIHQLFLIKFFTLFVGSFVLFSLIGYSSIKSIIIEENTTHLKQTIAILVPMIQESKNLDKLSSSLNHDSPLRITLIDVEGRVVAESDTDKESMQNHANREEIIALHVKDIGESVRFSDTLKIDFLYVAKKISYRDELLYLRLAMPLTTVMESFYRLLVKLALAFCVVLVVAFIIAKQMSHRVLYDIRQLKSYLEEISSKNYAVVVHIKYIHEFLELSLILKNIIKRLQKKDKKK